jgi:hypothetical protein
VQRQAAPSIGSAAVTINDTAPTNDRWNLALIEIPAAATAPAGDTTAPTTTVTAPAAAATLSGTVALAADATDDVGVSSVQFQVDGVDVGAADTSAPYAAQWDTTTVGNGPHAVRAVARDSAGNAGTSAAVTVTVNNTSGSGTFNPGNPAGTATVPAGMGLEDVSRPDHVVGDGTPAGCTSAAVVSAVAAGGVITFNCGPDPMTITLTQTLKAQNSTQKLVIDGGGKVTLSGGNANRILVAGRVGTVEIVGRGRVLGQHSDRRAAPVRTVGGAGVPDEQRTDHLESSAEGEDGAAAVGSLVRVAR